MRGGGTGALPAGGAAVTASRATIVQRRARRIVRGLFGCHWLSPPGASSSPDPRAPGGTLRPVRSAGMVATVEDLGLSDHVCWSYDGLADFRHEADRFLRDGIALGQRAVYVGQAPVSQLHDELAATPGLATLLAEGALAVASVGDTYRSGQVVDPVDQVDAYAAATREAVAEGFTGLRVAAEATELVRTPEQRTAFARYEQLIDRFMTEHPFAAMCGYRRDELGADALGEIACVHPLVREGDAPFQLHAGAGRGLQLAGEVDALSASYFAATADRAASEAQGTVPVDASCLRFIDHQGLVALEAVATRRDLVLDLRGAPPVVGRVVDLLRLTHVRAS